MDTLESHNLPTTGSHQKDAICASYSSLRSHKASSGKPSLVVSESRSIREPTNEMYMNICWNTNLAMAWFSLHLSQFGPAEEHLQP